MLGHLDVASTHDNVHATSTVCWTRNCPGTTEDPDKCRCLPFDDGIKPFAVDRTEPSREQAIAADPRACQTCHGVMPIDQISESATFLLLCVCTLAEQQQIGHPLNQGFHSGNEISRFMVPAIAATPCTFIPAAASARHASTAVEPVVMTSSTTST